MYEDFGNCENGFLRNQWLYCMRLRCIQFMLAQLQIPIVPPIVFVPTKYKYGNTVVITTASFSNKQVCCLLRCLPEAKLLRTPDESSLNQNSPTRRG